jgi:hypothetical protein
MSDRYRVTEVKCKDCGYSIHEYPGLGETLEEGKARHDVQHASGQCPRCGHWNSSHRPETEVGIPCVDGADLDPDILCCTAPAGMGDVCGCDGNSGPT